MIVFKEQVNLKSHLNTLKQKQYTIGFVPTMGALHKGHLSLVEAAFKRCDTVVVSVFVNPTQFDNAADLEKYPRTLEKDTALLKTISKDKIVVYAPTANDVYNNNISATHFDFDGLEFEMEGKFRQGHFNGVGTIVKQLFEIVEPTHAFFGEKDFQQLQIIKKLVKKHQIPVTVNGCAIFREANGLAMSSRNQRLTPEHKKAAPFIYKTLTKAKEHFGTKSANKVTKWVETQFKNHPLLKLEYFMICDTKTLKPMQRKSSKKIYRAFIAVYAGDIRLIDNIALN